VSDPKRQHVQDPLLTGTGQACGREELIGRINRKLRGWSNYFRIGTVSKAYRNINSHTRYRVRQWLCAKFKEQGQGKKRFSDPYLHQKSDLWPQLFSDVNCIALWTSSEKNPN
jgi:hypothetical protein